VFRTKELRRDEKKKEDSREETRCKGRGRDEKVRETRKITALNIHIHVAFHLLMAVTIKSFFRVIPMYRFLMSITMHSLEYSIVYNIYGGYYKWFPSWW
jgi:hypothetical protein